MKKIVLFTLISVVICLVNGQNETPKDKVNVNPEPIPITTVSPTSSSESPTTSAAPVTTTTTTTTTQQPTTTSKVTTTSATTKPTPTTTPTTTEAPTTIKPTPKPKPEIGTWGLNYTGTNRSCIVVKMALELMITYERTDNQIGNASLVLPLNAMPSGSCNESENAQNLILSWNPVESVTDSITFSFVKNDTEHKYMLNNVDVEVNPDEVHFPMMKSNATIKASHDKEEFKTPLSMSYRCKPKDVLNITSNNSFIGHFIVSDLRMEAFHNTTGMNFDSAKDCEASETPGIVPIAVGCSLAALIIIVLITYLLGRRRTQARGYLSMFSEKQREAEYIPMKNISCFGK